MSREDDIKKLIVNYERRLQILREQKALHGLDTSPQILVEIEDIEVILEELYAELEVLKSRLNEGETRVPGTELERFWKPFVNEGAKFFVPYEAPADASNTKMMVLTMTMQAVFNMYHLLVEQFAASDKFSLIQLGLGGVISRNHRLSPLLAASHPHLIVIGAPGANPLSNYLLAQFKGVSLADTGSTVHQGYIFRVKGNYLGSSFIISEKGLKKHYSSGEQAAMQEIDIYDLSPDNSPHCFPRTLKRYAEPSADDQDCALIVTGWASLPGENRIRRVIIIAGHSRHATLFSTAFVATNEAWAREINALSYSNTETIVGLQPDTSSSAPAGPSILAGPREIYKQPPSNFN